MILKASSTPPRHLAIYQASKLFLIAISTLGGLIEKVLVPSIASRHLVDQSSFCSWFCWVVPRHLLDTSAVNDLFLDTFLDRCLDTSRHCICRDLLLALFKLLVRSGTHFIRSLSRYFSLFSPKRSHLTPIFVPQGLFKLFQEFLHLVSF